MLILGIDTSCDDTSAALLEIDDNKLEVISNIVSSQSEIHNKYGGIVPELASRQHMQMIWPVVKEALGDRDLSEVDAIAACYGPGLIGSLLVGCSFAKALSYSNNIPFIAVNHLEGHLLSAFLEGYKPQFPFFSLIVSGGHTSLYRVNNWCQYEELGRTRDDAAGEAYDKVAKMLELSYPGGPVIDKLASQGDPKAVKLPRPYMPKTYDFSFSGLKTAVRLVIQNNDNNSSADISAGFQASVVDVLIRKIERAVKEFNIPRVSISGGVAANSELRKRMSEACENMRATLYLPSMAYCTDNAAMIAIAGYHRLALGQTSDMNINPKAHLPLI